MATDLWMRNPHGWREQLRDLAFVQIAWNELFLQERRISADQWHSLHIAPGQPFRALHIGVQQTVEMDQDHPMSNPVAVHPSWVHGQADSRLEAMLREQMPLVAVVGIPPYVPPFTRFFDWLSDMQEQYPDTKIHLHGGSSYSYVFGLGFRSADWDPLLSLRRGEITLPCGKQFKDPADFAAWGKWFRLIGYDWRKLKTLQDKIDFNITSAYWAADHYNENINFRIRKDKAAMEYMRTEVPEGGYFLNPKSRREAELGDKVICDSCSLAPKCKLYREGAVCTLSEAPTSELARLFTTRDSNKIIEGIGKLVAMNAERLEEGRAHESHSEDGLDDSVTKLIANLIDQGVKLAKLVNPALVNPKFQLNVGILQQAQGVPPHQLAAAAIAQLEASGYSREQITMDMVERLIAEQAQQPVAAIEVESYEDTDADSDA